MKVHLRNGQGQIAPACHLRGGREHGTVTLSPASFKATEADERCSKCEAVFLKRRNAQRKSACLEPVNSITA